MRKLAEKYHAGQFRKGKEQLPYIVHPQAVVNTLLAWGENRNSDAVLTAWGHDLLEDTRVSEQEILAVSDKNVLDNIKMLTKPENMAKNLYMQNVAECGKRDVLTVKAADRLCNTKDFISLKGHLYAFRYLHSADCLLPALEKFRNDPVIGNALNDWKKLDDTLRTKARQDAIRGCLLGGAVGDALGSPVEFLSLSSIKRTYGDTVKDYVEFDDNTGAITDDTQMTLFTAEGLLRAITRGEKKGICDGVKVVANAYARWLKTQGITANVPENVLTEGWLIKEKALYQCRAPGNTCLSALEAGNIPAKNSSKGCGTVMRMAPVGLLFSPEEAYKIGCDLSAITHGHPTGITSGGAFAMLIALLCNGKSLKESLDTVKKHLQKFPEAAETLQMIKYAECAGDITELGEGWVAEEALAISIFCALRHEWDFTAGVLEAINITGDSDSTGAITGNILGILNGENAIAGKWRKNLREYAIVSRMAEDLHIRKETDENGCITENWWKKYPGY